ncbi:hypothetical protein J5226_04475 [Lysobacter sp. K5869]|uniref:hypothetical protein n=1 Tax=Lysobacter sp. K5869 TaxID=2820808 RepID=UPI001C062806|nr:hypothetical protein [Lysobacter sp. K5869]QWP77673.1 hypothetical protein J5226_04475 [Lysobacter sp. K5869]
MRLMPLAAIASLALLAACTAPDKAKDAAAPAPAADGAASATAQPAAQSDPSAQPSAKIGADQVGKLSPVPAFKGFGEHWSIDIQSTGEMNHKVDLTWGSGSEKASGTARYNGQPADAPSTLIVLSGELKTKDGAKSMVIEISKQECIDDGDNKHMQSVDVTVDGMDKLTGGCGDLAVY